MAGCAGNHRDTYGTKIYQALEKTQFLTAQGDFVDVKALVVVFQTVRKAGGGLYLIGNGGSAGIAIHMTADYLKNGRMRTVSMYNPATITCLGNDFGYEFVFSKQLELLARPDDLLVAISSSGNSPNILYGIETAKEKGCRVVTLTGFRDDNRARRMGDLNIYVPSMEYGIVESVHNIILQQAVDVLMEDNEEEQSI